MEGDGNSVLSNIPKLPDSKDVDEKKDVSSDVPVDQEQTQVETVGPFETDSDIAVNVTAENEKDNSKKDSDENIDEEGDDKEGGSDTQSEPFEIVKVEDNGSLENADDEQVSVETAGQDNQSDKKEEEKEDDCMDILGNGLLKKKVLEKGQGRASRPQHSDLVTVKIEGRLNNGAVVDKHDNLSFVLGDGDVIQALDLCVSLMDLGEQCELETAPKYAYGETGREPDIPSDATITYKIELLSKEESPGIGSLTIQQRITKGEAKRERGNYLFLRKEYTGAIGSYTKALTILEHTGSSSGADTSALQEVLDCKVKCYNNLAACQLKIEAYDAAIRSCEGVLKSQPENVKALYRIGKAYGSKGDTEEALVYLRKALKLDPSSKILHAEMSKLSQKLKKETDSEKQMYRRMMGTTGDASRKENGGASWWKLPLMFGGVLAGVVSVGLAVAYRYGQH